MTYQITLKLITKEHNVLLFPDPLEQSVQEFFDEQWCNTGSGIEGDVIQIEKVELIK